VPFVATSLRFMRRLFTLLIVCTEDSEPTQQQAQLYKQVTLLSCSATSQHDSVTAGVRCLSVRHHKPVGPIDWRQIFIGSRGLYHRVAQHTMTVLHMLSVILLVFFDR